MKTDHDLVELNANSTQAVEVHDINQDEDTGSFVPRPPVTYENEHQHVPTLAANYPEITPLPLKNDIVVAPSLVRSPGMFMWRTAQISINYLMQPCRNP